MAGLREETRRIGDAVYRVNQLPYGTARPLIWLGASVVTPALEAAKGLNVLALLAGETSAITKELEVDMIGRAFKIFFDRASEDDFCRVDDLFTQRTHVQVDGTKAFVPLASIRELHWPSRYGDFAKWLGFSVEVHFGPFSQGSMRAEGDRLGASMS